MFGGTDLQGFPPSFAKAFGYTKTIFFDSFRSLSTLDTGDTRVPGFKWYLTNFDLAQGMARTKTNAAWLSAANSTLNISSSFLTHGGMELASVAYLGNSSVVGQTIAASKGFYSEIKSQFNWPSNNDFHPVFWMQDLTGTYHYVENTAPSVNFAEIDVCEVLASGAKVQQNLNMWNSATTFSSTASGGTYSGVDYTQSHQWGALVVPMAQNGGTGLLRFYLDRVSQGSDITWTSTSSQFYPIEQANFILFLDGDVATYNYNIEYVAVCSLETA